MSTPVIAPIVKITKAPSLLQFELELFIRITKIFFKIRLHDLTLLIGWPTIPCSLLVNMIHSVGVLPLLEAMWLMNYLSPSSPTSLCFELVSILEEVLMRW